LSPSLHDDKGERQITGTKVAINPDRDFAVAFEHGIEPGTGLKLKHRLKDDARACTMEVKN
jgi:hypothetical protein